MTRSSSVICTVIALLAGCSDNSQEARSGDLPQGGLYATIAVGEAIFHVNVTNEQGMEEARGYWTGQNRANIPSGQLICSPVGWNRPWRWHLNPETTRFAEATIEVCDGDPHAVESGCEDFGGGHFCPWSAEMVDLRDCNEDPECPPVPRAQATKR